MGVCCGLGVCLWDYGLNPGVFGVNCGFFIVAYYKVSLSICGFCRCCYILLLLEVLFWFSLFVSCLEIWCCVGFRGWFCSETCVHVS